MDKTNNEISRSFLDLLDIMVSLRNPDSGCEWDRSQDSHTLKKYCLEEAYEVVDAIENNNTEGLCEELGDLLFQVIFHAEINNEKGYFGIHEVINNLSKKMIRRHPHVFKDNSKQSSLKEIDKNWTKIKQKERIDRGYKYMLEDIPLALPAMTRSLKLQKRAAENGFDWEKAVDAYKKISEEKKELEVAMAKGDNSEIEEEIGDEIDAIVGISINGIPFAQAIAGQLDLDLAVSRSISEDEGAHISEIFASVSGKQVVVVDDVVSSGTTLKKTIKNLRNAGAEVKLCLVLANKSEANALEGVPLRGLVRVVTV